MVVINQQSRNEVGKESFLPGLSALRDSELLRILPLLLIAYSVILPQEVRISLAEQNIYPYRAAVILLLPWFVYQLVSVRLRFHLADGLTIFGCGWIIIAMIVVYSPLEGMLRGSAIAMDILAPYLAGRLCITKLSDFRRFLVFFAPGVGLVALAMLLEGIVGMPLVRPGAAQIFGPLPNYYGGEASSNFTYDPTFRFGLLRAAGPFAHPILAGLFLASLFPIYLHSKLRGWPGLLGTASSLIAILSWSSAAFIGLLISAALMGYSWLQQRVEAATWKVAAYIGALAALFVQFASQNGLVSIIVRMTLEPQTGYYRLLIWRFGMESIRNNPVFGIGYASYERYEWMNESIDAHWLNLGVRHGLPAAVILLGVAFIVSTALGVAASRSCGADRATILGVTFALFMMTIMGFTVAFFGGLMVWYFILVGIGLSLAQISSTPQ